MLRSGRLLQSLRRRFVGKHSVHTQCAVRATCVNYRHSIRSISDFSTRSSESDGISKKAPLRSPEAIIGKCLEYRASVQDVNDKFQGPLEKNAQKNTILPFVLLLGNHSSGKSSFINYVCQRKVQTAGVAPTDDSFTVIVPGPEDVDRDGPSCIGDPELGLSQLRSYGPTLVHQTKMKVRGNLAIKSLMLIDTPGMIDSPTVRDAHGNNKYAVMDRGYDFESVCKWYAERADVILLFFDPDKPGTTGETLSILTNSLKGLDHKLHIILNKADQFRKIHDFARAYGSLCWNLSKVIHRKDLPIIHTMCLPLSYQAHAAGSGGASGPSAAVTSLGSGLSDLEMTREEVVQAVLNAPKRRVDNEISRLTDALHLLEMHLTLMDSVVKSYRKQRNRYRLATVLSAVGSLGIASSTLLLSLPMEVVGSSFVLGTAGVTCLAWYLNKQQNLYAEMLVDSTSLEKRFDSLYGRKLGDKDEFITSIWERVRVHLAATLSSTEIAHLEPVPKSDLSMIRTMLDTKISELRRASAPPFHKPY